MPIGQALLERLCQLRLAVALVGQAEQFNHGLACRTLRQLLAQAFEGQSIGLARKDLIAVDQVEQRHGLAAQRVDDVPVVDDVAVLAIGTRTAALQRHQGRVAQEQFQPVVVQPHTQAMADQPRRDGIEHLAQDEAAGGRDVHARFLVVRRTLDRKWLKQCPLGLNAFAITRVDSTDDLVDEAAIGTKIVEVVTAAQKQRITHCALEVAMRALDGAVLMGNAAVVARRLHSVVSTERFVTRGEIVARFAFEIAERRRQAVAAVLARCATEHPQRVLQPFGQRDIALAAEDDVSVLKARAGQPEMIQTVIQRNTRHGDAQAVHLGEIGQAEATRLMHLTEHDVTFLAMLSAPVANTSLQRTAHAAREVWMAPKHLVKYRYGPDARSGLEQRDDLGVKDRSQGISTATRTWCLLLRWQSPVLIDAITRGGAEPGACACLGRLFLASVLHIGSLHLVVVDVTPGHRSLLVKWKLFPSYPISPRPPTRLPDDGDCSARWQAAVSGLRPPPLPPRQFSS